MIQLNQSYEMLVGGYYTGNLSWNQVRTDSDNCFKIYQLTEGEVFIRNKQQTVALQSNKVYFINGHKVSHYYCNKPFKTNWFHFIPKDIIFYQVLQTIPMVVELPVDKFDFVKWIPDIEQMLMSDFKLTHQYVTQVLKMQTYLQMIILELLAMHSIDELSLSSEIKRIDPAIYYINKHFREPIKLEDLAELCCMSPNYFHQIFKSALNTTPANYITLLRMNTALQLLIDKQYSIKNIAYELGFSDDAHFCRSFKKFYGITPGNYKKRRTEILL